MASFSRKYLTKLLAVVFTFIILLSLISAACLNIALYASKIKILEEINKTFSQKISITNAFFLPPNFIIVKDVSLTDVPSGDRDAVLFIPTLKINFSLYKLITKKRVVLSNISIAKPIIKCPKFYSFLKDNSEQIIEFLKRLPKGDIKISLNEALLEWPNTNNKADFIIAKFIFTVKADSFFGAGSLSKGNQGFFLKNEPLNCQLKGLSIKEGFILDNLELMRKNFYLKLWGSRDKNKLQLRGFSFVNDLFNDFASKTPTKESLNILDINCRLNLKFPDIEIERFDFFLNNMPSGIKGNLSLSESLGMDLKCCFYPKYISNNSADSLKEIDLQMKGTLEKKTFKGDLNLEIIKNTLKEGTGQRAKLDIKELILYFSMYPEFKMLFKEAVFVSDTNNTTYKLLFNNFDSIFYHQNKIFKFFRIKSGLYDGLLEAKGSIDVGKFPFQSVFDIKVEGASANKFSDVLIHFSKVHGKLDSQMSYVSYPKLNFNGNMNMREGYLEDFEFFKWLADFFSLPSLRRIDFSNLSADFLVTDKTAGLDNINLESREVGLSGNFGLREDDFVNSKISLGLTSRLLSESEKFKPLIRILGEGFNSLDFNFQLSGVLSAMNFQWLESDFKTKLQDSIPGFIERKIEKQVENTIESISKKDVVGAGSISE